MLAFPCLLDRAYAVVPASMLVTVPLAACQDSTSPPAHQDTSDPTIQPQTPHAPEALASFIARLPGL